MKHTIEQANQYIQSHQGKVVNDYRPLFHFAPPIGWANDPNGFVFFQNQYHLFYQYYPYAPQWGPMHWGHAVTSNLLDFENRDVALAPDHALESGCFSGGAVVNPKDPNTLWLTYTQHLETFSEIRECQNLVTTHDGKTFTKRETPILDASALPHQASLRDFRDPRPIFLEPYYYLFVGSQHTSGVGQILVFRGKSLESLTYHMTIGPDVRFGKVAECPDYFVLDGQDILLLSATQLESDGKRFKNVNSSLVVLLDVDFEKRTHQIVSVDEIDLGHDFYAPQTLIDPHQRRIMTAWMSMWGKTNYTASQGHGWAGSFILPRELSIKNGRLFQWPISEIETKHADSIDFRDGIIIKKQADMNLLFKTSKTWELRFENREDSLDYFTLGMENKKVYFESSKSKEYPQDRRTSFYSYLQGIQLRIILDTSSIEIFMDGGRETMTSVVYMNCRDYRLCLAKGDASQVSGHVHGLK